MEKDEAPPEAKLIAERREALMPKVSQNKAGEMIGISGNRWRQIEKGYQTVSAGKRAPVIAPAATLAKMAQLVGVAPEELTAVGRDDAAESLRGLLQTKDSPLLPAAVMRLDATLSEVTEAPSREMFMSSEDRLLLTRVRNKLVHGLPSPLTDQEAALLNRFIEDEELRSLHLRIDRLPRDEQLEVSTFVNELQGRVDQQLRDMGVADDLPYKDFPPAAPKPHPLEHASQTDFDLAAGERAVGTSEGRRRREEQDRAAEQPHN